MVKISYGLGILSRQVVSAGGQKKIRVDDNGSKVTMLLPGCFVVSSNLAANIDSIDTNTGGALAQNLYPTGMPVGCGYVSDNLNGLGFGVKDSSPDLIIVDDDEDHIASLARVLGRSSLTVETFTTVEAALKFISHSCGSKIICDAHMPDGGADKLLRELAHQGLSLRCAVMSGESSDDLQYRLAALGAREFFSKPVSIERLVDWVGQSQHQYIQEAKVG